MRIRVSKATAGPPASVTGITVHDIGVAITWLATTWLMSSC